MSILKKWKKKELRDWARNLDESKRTLYGIIINIVMFSIIELLIGLFFVNKYNSFIIGIVLGGIVAIAVVRNMYSNLEKCIIENEDTAEGIVRRGAIFRMLGIFVVFVFAIFLKRYINIYAMSITIFSLKFAAYLTPFTNKYLFTRYVTKGR